MSYRKDLTPKNAKGEPHGDWVCYYSDNTLHYKASYHNGLLVGYDEWHWGGCDDSIEKVFHIR